MHRLAALDSPPAGVQATASELLSFPATQLFVQRASAAGYHFESSDAEALVVAEICRKLDGNPLAIELTAGRTGTLDLQEIAALLGDRLTLLWRGRRTAVTRHQTLRATLDWSHNLIGDVERAVLRRLSVFASAFTTSAAQSIAADDSLHTTLVADALQQLVAKSLVQAAAEKTLRRYRLLDTTRAYARSKLEDSGEAHATARRHAIHFCSILEGSSIADDPAGRRPFSATCARHGSGVSPTTAIQCSARNWWPPPRLCCSSFPYLANAAAGPNGRSCCSILRRAARGARCA